MPHFLNSRVVTPYAAAAALLGALGTAHCGGSDDDIGFAPVAVGGSAGAAILTAGSSAAGAGASLVAGGAAGATMTGGSTSGGSGGGSPSGGSPSGGTGGISSPCPEGQLWCNVSGFVGCITLGSLEHCSACGLGCGAGESCEPATAGGFECTCGSGTRCGTVCVDPERDEANCGTCSTQCGQRAECTGTCGCTDPDYPDEHANDVTGLTDCYDFDSDANHCGSFDAGCLPGEDCVNGACTCPAPSVYCPDATTPVECVDTETDARHCLGCGNECPANGVCTPAGCACQAGQTVCGASETSPGTCANTDTHRDFCGADCVTCNEGAICEAGTCACPAGTTVCLGAGGVEICVDTTTSEEHCSACGEPCGQDEECWDSACVASPCAGLCATSSAFPRSGERLETSATGCFELTEADVEGTSLPRITGWSMSGRTVTVNGVSFSGSISGDTLPDMPLGTLRVGGWCVELGGTGGGTVYVPVD